MPSDRRSGEKHRSAFSFFPRRSFVVLGPCFLKSLNRCFLGGGLIISGKLLSKVLINLGFHF